MSETSVSTLVLRARDNDAAAWALLVRRFERMVWSVIRTFAVSSDDGVDLAQTVWLKAVQSLDRISDPERFGLWLRTTTRNECIRFVQVRRRTLPVDPQDSFVSLATDNDPSVSIDDAERDRLLWTAFTSMPAPCQRLLRLLLLEPPMQYSEVSSALGIAIGTIGPQRQRCLRRLRDRYEAAQRR